MKFYTNVAMYGNRILVRGYEHGERFQKEVYYNPYLFVNPPKSEEKSCGYYTIKNKPVKKVVFDDIYSAREYIKRYDIQMRSNTMHLRYLFVVLISRLLLRVDIQTLS